MSGQGAGIRYVLPVFMLGVLLGALRQTLLAPAVGPLWATALELPFMLAASGYWCRQLVREAGWPAGDARRRIMGGTALACLLFAECLLDLLIGGRDPIALVLRWLQPAGALGLAGQLLFALFPLWVARSAATVNGSRD